MTNRHDCAASIGIRELQQHASHHVRRVEHGAELVVTRQGRAVARLVPAAPTDGQRDRLIAAGRLRPARRPWDWTEVASTAWSVAEVLTAHRGGSQR